MVHEIREGITWLWRQPFLRAALLLVAASNFVFQALTLALIVIARDHGASSAEIGLMLGMVSAGGVLGALVAPRLQRRVPAKLVVVGANWIWAALIPLIALLTDPLELGSVLGVASFVGALWNVVIGAYQLSLIPDRLLGRVMSVDLLLAFGAIPLGALAGGLLLEAFGGAASALILAGAMAAVAVAATASRGVRAAPTLEEARVAATAASAARV
jgi:predicted MFS family arabinose efflux permease